MRKHRKKKIPPNPTQATIESLSHEGRGIAHIDGKTIFISDALPGETVLFNYTNTKKNFDEGEAIEIQNPSPNRSQPDCPSYKICGGCSLQHLNHAAQIQHKENVLLEQLRHFGKTEPKEVLPPLLGPIWAYRNKARLSVRFVPKKEKLLIGFREKDGRFVADMDQCSILHTHIGKKLHILKESFLALDCFASIAQIEVAASEKQTALIIRHLKPLSDNDQKQLCDFGEQQQFDIYLQPQGADSIHKIWPTNSPERLSYSLLEQEVTLFFHPSDFTQINETINQKMIQTAITLLRPTKEDVLLDLFCGLGNFTLPLAKHCKQIIGVEGSSKMSSRAKENAHHNQINNADFFASNLEEDFSTQPWANQTIDKLVLDPPRSGALNIIQNIHQLNPKEILYISCNPSTLARDAGELTLNHKYHLQKVGIMDMFPHTSHIESIALFIKK